MRGEDALGNVNDTVFDEKFTIVDAAAAVSLASVSPKEAGTRALAKISSNVPIYILPQNLITDVPDEDAADDGSGGIDTANLELANDYANAYSQENSMVITKNDTYTLYVCDDLGRTSKLTLTVDESSVTFGNDIGEPTVETYIVTDVYGYYDGVPGDSFVDLLGTERKKVEEGEYAPAYTVYEWLSSYGDNTLESDGGKYFDIESISYALVEVTAADGTYLQPNDDQDTYYNELYFDEDLSADYLTDYGYSKMIYEVWQLWDYDNWVALEQYVRDLPVKTCTEEGYSLGDYQDMVLIVDNIDNTEPKISITYDPMAFDWTTDSGGIAYTLGDVTVDVLISDPQSGIEYIDIEGYCEDDSLDETLGEDYDFTISLVDENGDPIDYMTEPYTYSNEYVDIELYSDTDLKTTKYLRFIIHYDSFHMIYPCNTCGMYGYVADEGVWVNGINRIELSDSDYTLEYFYEDNNGDWQPADPDDEDTYFRKGKAVITPTDADNSRGLYVSNNGGSWTKELSILEPSYTFVLKDQYGYTLNVDAALKNFDITPGTIEYSFDDTTLTNSAPITITAQDSPSGVGSVTLSHNGVTETLTEVSVDADGVYTYNETLTSSGTYTITLTDKVGNVTEKIFIVSTIDTVAPELLNVIYSTTKVTSKSVTALLKYTKSNVTLTEVEPVQDGFEDYEVDYANSLIRFYDNGSLTVTFTDAYGNIGYGTVGVSNIYNIPPSLTAVMTPSADTLSVDVTFEKATDNTGAYIDTKRELTDVTVLYGGIAQRAQTIDEEGNVTDAKYTFAANGTYTFTVYDDEGVTSYITIEITGIDKSAPQITQVSWSYYYDEYDDTSGEWKTAQLTETWNVGDEEGYVIATDKKPITNYDVDVTVTADSETTISGKTNSESGTDHTLTYSDNGMYIFNLEKPNGTLASYGFDVEVIDKIPPVIELNSEELLFYENPEMGEAYDRDLIDKCFTASDTFLGTVTDLTDKVTIDYGNFDPDDINNNKFDRSIAYTITYSVTDSANNTTEARMTVRLVALTDTIALVNSLLPNASNQAEVDTKNLTINLKNFSGISYAKIEEGALSMGKMKTSGTVIEEAKDENGNTISGEYQYTVDSNGWYTILVQTDKRDYFNLQIYVWESE
ncbi:MAG: hypothetical protein LIO59_07385 [Oscillospiraceae bacterium]|nr:hypothetical protein [Oscillospiraceae bacterium]